MNTLVQHISIYNLALSFIPVAIALYFIHSWSLNAKQATYALARMLVQLMLIGYLLSSIFYSDNPWLVNSILLCMVIISCWIALRITDQHRKILFKHGFIAILIGGGFTIFIVTQAVLSIKPWYQAQIMIPLAGMIFANCMNSISLSAERVLSELGNGKSYNHSRSTALNAATIPNINALFAVGLVSLPGMMTGQILSGVSPLIAARYQIVVMCMIFSSAVLSSALFLILAEKEIKKAR